ncbi:protein-glutamate O-methyltransferase CheR [Oceanicola sp. 22II-s10i]|uniref:CheR family methyltransferase n=1 Tax=Oceanicola sp. 22II-s10i TaxID=1317116 RepID=UPI000B5201AE|nr:protein-glutamate O-methyltransferase CheR [Oceanicola sp. 22II-s10i]
MAAGTTPAGMETLSPRAFSTLAQLVQEEAGILLQPGKTAMVQSRLRSRLRALGLPDFDAYVRHVCSEAGGAERRQMLSALTTNVSHFFREMHHFEILRLTALPPLIARARQGGRVRLWSAGCSTGQEPYSIAMELLKLAPDIGRFDLRILASDIDAAVLATAEGGRYGPTQVQGIPVTMQEKFLSPAAADGTRCVSEEVRELVRFRELNLIRAWPMAAAFDIIFCRNVVIYFDQATQLRLWPRFRAAISHDGWLFLGHSERIPDQAAGLFRPAGLTAYRPDGTAGYQS